MLLALGLLAMALHLVAGSGMTRAAPALGGNGGFLTELCTSHGVVKMDLGQSGGKVPAGEAHDCCTLCAAGAPLLAAGHDPAVAPAPTFHAAQDWRSRAPRPHAPRTAQAPRGPPVMA
jgi:hypothetical protein